MTAVAAGVGGTLLDRRIAEDTAILREGLAQLLADRGFEVRATVGDGDALLAAVAEHRPT